MATYLATVQIGRYYERARHRTGAGAAVAIVRPPSAATGVDATSAGSPR